MTSTPPAPIPCVTHSRPTSPVSPAPSRPDIAPPEGTALLCQASRATSRGPVVALQDSSRSINLRSSTTIVQGNIVHVIRRPHVSPPRSNSTRNYYPRSEKGSSYNAAQLGRLAPPLHLRSPSTAVPARNAVGCPTFFSSVHAIKHGHQISKPTSSSLSADSTPPLIAPEMLHSTPFIHSPPSASAQSSFAVSARAPSGLNS